jgi:hypothetical protein
MHVQTEGTAVDLGGSKLDQTQERLLQTAPMKIMLETEHRFIRARGHFLVMKTRFHSTLLSVQSKEIG